MALRNAHRKLTCEDRLDIHDLLVRFSHTWDEGDAEGWANCFTDDATYESRRGRIVGKQAIKQYAAAATAPQTYRHFVGNILVTPSDTDENAASVASYLLFYQVGAEGHSFKVTALQRDQLVKSNGEWKIRERIVTADPWCRLP